MAYLRIGETQARALKVISELDASKFQGIVASIVDAKKFSIRSSELLSLVTSLSKDEEFSSALCSQAIALASFQRAEKLSVQEVVSSLIAGIEMSNLESNVVEWFTETRRHFEALIECNAVSQPAKALYLSTDFQQLYASGNVLTDVRPVFANEHKELSGAVVTQTLRIKCVDAGVFGGGQELSLALDADDIDKLIEELQKAKLKAECAKAKFAEVFGENIFVVGEETYGFG